MYIFFPFIVTIGSRLAVWFVQGSVQQVAQYYQCMIKQFTHNIYNLYYWYLCTCNIFFQN